MLTGTFQDDHHLDVGVDDEVDDVLALEMAVAAVAADKKPKKKRGAPLRKAPNAPKRFKSSYICFFMAKQAQIQEELGDKASVSSVSKRSAELWKDLPADERAHWEEVAAKDKQRYMNEKASYTGPWQVPWKRSRKDPSAPKRPMSAFLYYSQGKRSEIKANNPGMKNTEVSKMLGQLWQNLPEEERAPHVAREKEERERYKVAIAEWRKETEAKHEAEKKARAEQAEFSATMASIPDFQSHPQYPTADQFGALQLPMGNPYMLQNYHPPSLPRK